MPRDREGEMHLDPYMCTSCKRVYAYLDLMGDPVCECEDINGRWFPVRFSTQLLDALDERPASADGDPEELEFEITYTPAADLIARVKEERDEEGS